MSNTVRNRNGKMPKYIFSGLRNKFDVSSCSVTAQSRRTIKHLNLKESAKHQAAKPRLYDNWKKEVLRSTKRQRRVLRVEAVPWGTKRQRRIFEMKCQKSIPRGKQNPHQTQSSQVVQPQENQVLREKIGVSQLASKSRSIQCSQVKLE